MNKKVNAFFLAPGLITACCAVCSCSNGTPEKNTYTDTSIEKETELLTSEEDLNALMSRSDDGIVDWQLSREFAEMTLEDYTADGDFPEDAELWQIPIAIYDASGEIRYYEFRVVSGGKVIGAVAGNAKEKYGCPVARIFPMDGYMDSLNELYASGALAGNDIPRIVDNDYPSYAVAAVSVSRGGNITAEKIVDPGTGDVITDLAHVMNADEAVAAYPDMLSEQEKTTILQENASYTEDMNALWSMAKANKGNLNNFTFRGKRKSPRKSVDSGRIANAHMRSYGACGFTAAGFILDFLSGNNIDASNWSNFSIDKKKSIMTDYMNPVSIGNGTAVFPADLDNAIIIFSRYRLSWTLTVPKECINSNLPGISLRAVKDNDWEGGFHYRNVVAYDEKGWWIFTWPEMKILDGNGIDGGWETYTPFYNLASYNLVKK